jgi:hypothetical protein
MRFASKFGRFGVQIRPMVQEAYATGMAKVIQEPVYAMFEPWDLLPHERELCIARWSFNGFYQQEDEVTVLPPDMRIGVYDSVRDAQLKGWPDEIRLEVERVLIANASITDNVLVLPVSVYAPPWPRYDDFDGTNEALLAKLIEDGHNLVDTLAYERSAQNRPDVVSTLEELIADPDALLELQPETVEEIVG